MLALKLATPANDLSEYAGVYLDSLTDTPPNGRLPADGTLVNIATFPKLFAKIGHLYTSGTVAGIGSEGDSFRLPLPTGRFLKPTDDGRLPGTLTEDRTSTHTHNTSTDAGIHGSHSVYPVAVYGGQYYFDHNYITPDDPSEMASRGTYGESSYTSDTGGDHSHTAYLNASVGAETRPYSMNLPTFLITGEVSDTCIAIVYGVDWTTTPGYNSVIPAKSGIETACAKENIHTYRIRFPEVSAGVPTVDTAHVEIARQLQKLRTMYRNVWVIGIGTGAHLAAMAMTLPNLLWVANKFVGINGIYDLSASYAAAFIPAVTAYLGGITPALKVKGTPIQPYYPAKCWHGADNLTFPSSQSSNWTANTVIVPSLPPNSNLITAGLFPDILTFFRS